MMRWRTFIGASLVVGGVLVKFGAPLIPVIAGIGFAAAWNFYQNRERRTA
jgi:hypothetical protein